MTGEDKTPKVPPLPFDDPSDADPVLANSLLPSPSLGGTDEESEGETSAPAIAGVRPPINLLVLGVTCVAVSVALLPLASTATHVVGYVLASVVTISLVGFFHRIDLQRRQSALYVSGRALGRWAGLIAALGVGVAAVHTWSIATAFAK